VCYVNDPKLRAGRLGEKKEKVLDGPERLVCVNVLERVEKPVEVAMLAMRVVQLSDT
jgi:hypothetical protein